jgi:xanthine dehydrogenase accessory factor
MAVKQVNRNKSIIVIKGAGDLASGIAYRLFRCGLGVIMTEIDKPLVVRRKVAFAEAVHASTVNVEGVSASLVRSAEQVTELLVQQVIPVLVDPRAEIVNLVRPVAVIDARMAKRNLGTTIDEASLVVGVGPGFTAGLDVHAVIETCRGHNLGRVIYSGSAAPNTGAPGAIDGHTWKRLLRAPADGIVSQTRAIGDMVEKGELVVVVGNTPIYSDIEGVIRGMIKENIWVSKGTKIGDIDPRKDTDYHTISDKSLAVGGGALEAIFHFLASPRDNLLGNGKER